MLYSSELGKHAVASVKVAILSDISTYVYRMSSWWHAFLHRYFNSQCINNQYICSVVPAGMD